MERNHPDLRKDVVDFNRWIYSADIALQFTCHQKVHLEWGNIPIQTQSLTGRNTASREVRSLSLSEKRSRR